MLDMTESQIDTELDTANCELKPVNNELTPGSFRYDMNAQKCAFILQSLPGLKIIVSMPTVNQLLQLKTWAINQQQTSPNDAGDDQLAIMFSVIAGKGYEVDTGVEVELDYDSLLNSIKMDFAGDDLNLFFRCFVETGSRDNLAKVFIRSNNVDQITKRMDQS